MSDIELDYKTVVGNGNVIRRSSSHTPGGNCDCRPGNPLANYRDLIVDYMGNRYIYYHNTAIVVELADGSFRLSSGGWETKSTKERINQHLPGNCKLVQKDYDWYINKDGELIEFESGMIIDPRK